MSEPSSPAELAGYHRCQRCETWHRSPDALGEREGVRVCVDERECIRTVHAVRDMPRPRSISRRRPAA